MKIVLALGALALAGCASTEAPSAAGGTAATTASSGGVVYPSGPAHTGSRLMNRSTDRTIRVIGNQDIKDDAGLIQSIGNDPAVGSRGN